MADKFKVGDRIEYFHGTNDHAQERVGKTGTIDGLGDNYGQERRYRITWDDSYKAAGSYRESNLKLARAKPTQAEIDDALSLLREAGDVTFKPRKPPFEIITVSGVGGYTAKVTDKHVVVGCKTIPFTVIEEVAAAVAKARAYNAD